MTTTTKYTLDTGVHLINFEVTRVEARSLVIATAYVNGISVRLSRCQIHRLWDPFIESVVSACQCESLNDEASLRDQILDILNDL